MRSEEDRIYVNLTTTFRRKVEKLFPKILASSITNSNIKKKKTIKRIETRNNAKYSKRQ